MTTASTTGVQDILRNRLLAFTAIGGAKLSDAGLLGANLARDLKWDQAPDDHGTVYTVLRLLPGPADGDDGGLQQRPTLEVHTYGRPRSAAARCEAVADLIQQALYQFQSNDDGLVWVTGLSLRLTLPPPPAPADRNLCTVRQLFDLTVWPRFMTQYAVPA